MAIWLIFATLATLGVTALLIAVLYRINFTAGEPSTPRDGWRSHTDGDPASAGKHVTTDGAPEAGGDGE